MLRRARRLGLQYARFGTVGLGATLTHVLLFVGLVELAGLAPLIANAVAFGTAVLVSFQGHFHWTFRAQTRQKSAQTAHAPGAADRARRRRRAALARFFVVALIGLALNSLAVYAVVNLLALPYEYALVPMVLVVPLALFALSKRWAFA